MFSKTMLRYSLMILGLALVSCGDFLSGKKKSPEVIELTDQKFACLMGLPKTLENMSKGDATEDEIEVNFSCLESALIYFKDRTTGTYKDAYTSSDFRRFFGKYFLKENNISDVLARELIRLKSAIFGGAPDTISKDEVVKISHFIGVLRVEIKVLVPYAHVLLMKSPAPSPEKIDRAVKVLNHSVLRLINKTRLYEGNYSFDDASVLLKEFLIFVENQGQEGVSTKFEKYWPLIGSVKKILYGEQLRLQGEKEWAEALDNVMDAYSLVLRQNYFLADGVFLDARHVQVLSGFLEDGLRLLENSYLMKRRGTIPVAYFDDLADQFLDPKREDSLVSPATAKETLRVFLGRLVEGPKFKGTHTFVGLSPIHIQELRQQLILWSSIQDWVNSFEKVSNLDIPWYEVVYKMGRYNFAKQLEDGPWKVDSNQKENLVKAWKHFVSLFGKNRPVQFNSSGRYMIVPTAGEQRTSWRGLTQANLVYLFCRVFVIGYGQSDRAIEDNVVTEESLVQWFTDFDKLGQEIKAFDRRTGNAGKRSFKEANFFATSSNGDRSMVFNELFEYLSMVVSGGLITVSDMRDQSASCELSQKDIFDLPYLDEKCFRDQIFKNSNALLEYLPGMVRYLKTQPATWETLYKNVMEVDRVSDPNGGQVEHGDIRAFVMMITYIESLFVSFDSNHDDFLEVSEIRKAAPRFVPFLKEIVTLPKVLRPVEDWALEQGFVYLILEGKKPTADTPQAVDELWQHIINRVGRGPSRVERKDIAKVFKALKDEMKK